MEWTMLPTEELIKKLDLPTEGVLDMVLDTDTYNEVDDQFALAYSLLSPERLNVLAIYAAPFFNTRSTGPADGMQRSYDEIVRLLGKMGRSADGFVYKGSTAYLTDYDTPVDSPAARDLVERAMARPDGDPLYVVAIGAITNVASALIMEPRITSKIVIVWLGGHSLSYPTAKEFNLMQDVPAVRVVMDCGAPVVLIPCLGVASHLLATVPELETFLGRDNALTDALIELFAAYHENDGAAWGKEIWDVSTIGYLMNPQWVPSVLKHSPLLTDDMHWGTDSTRHFIREAIYCKRNPIFNDMYQKLKKA